jgi:4-hydroxybenzoate polyprenyltransferase
VVKAYSVLAGREPRELSSGVQPLVFSPFRLTEPWRYKAPFLISIVYYFLYAGSVRFLDALLAVACAVCTIAGISGVGYITNDLADREQDRRSSRRNATLECPMTRTVALLALCTVSALLPWILFAPVNGVCAILLVLEFVLFLAYAAPPLRLKERGAWGLITDALYAHANPSLLAGYTLHLATRASYPRAVWFLGAMWVWQLFVGLRNILQHQISDAPNDRLAGTTTWVTQNGEVAAKQLLKIFVAPLEAIALMVWLLCASLTLPALAIVLGIHALGTAAVIRQYSGKIRNQPLSELHALFLDDFALGWVPLVILCALCVSNWRMITLLLFHLALFRHQLFPLFKLWVRSTRGLAAALADR